MNITQLLDKIYQSLYVDGEDVVLNMGDIEKHGISYEFNEVDLTYRFFKGRGICEFVELRDSGKFNDEQLEVMSGFYGGKKVVCKGNNVPDKPDKWADINKPSWKWDYIEYKIK